MNETGQPEVAADIRPWLKSYPPGVPPVIDEMSIGTLTDLFRGSVARYPDRPALESFGARLSYAELSVAVASVEAWLLAQGLAKGDRVAIMLPNVAAYPAILFGVLAAGGVVVNINPLYTARELAHQVNDSTPRFLFVLENFGSVVEECLPSVSLERVIIVAPGALLGLKGHLVNAVSRWIRRTVKSYRLPEAIPFGQVLKEQPRKDRQPVALRPDDMAFLQYTGGTTGVAKGAILTHRNVFANVLQTETWLSAKLEGSPGHIMVTALPLYHIFGLTICGMLMVRLGGCMLLIANARDVPDFVRTLRKRPFSLIAGVNTLYNALLHHPDVAQIDFSRLVLSVSGGMATQAGVSQKWQEVTGCSIMEGYGLSETSPLVCANRVDRNAFTGTVGYPMPSTDVSIRDHEGARQPMGESGELCVRGPQVMPGYWNRPDETARVMTPDGFFRTGDVAVLLPDGQVKIVDRMKDMVLVSGFNVYPNEVEEVLMAHPGVLEAAVVGTADEHSGESVVAYVVRKDPDLTETTLRSWCRDRLTGYKVPRQIHFRDSLPKSNVGKVLRRTLRDEAAAAH